jgi:hypothetical protein
MAGKQIIDLASSDSFSEGDLLLVRKSSMGVDRKITYADFVESIGSAAIDGYIALAEEEQENRIILKAANNAPVYKYYNGMKISFVSPIKSSDAVQIKIGDLSYKKLHRYAGDASVALAEGDYIEAVMIGEHFRQVNDLKDTANVYTNDYVVTASEIAPSNQFTVLTLQTAYGLRKQEYYKGMSILFTCPIDTKGIVRVNVDGLGLIDLKEGGSNEPQLNFKKGQTVFAVYDGKFFF